jgi:hypothetical protein
MDKEPAIIAVYNPPRPDLPHLAVIIYPNGTVAGATAKSAADAQAIVDGLAEKAGIKSAT